MLTPGMLFSFCVASLPLASAWHTSVIHQAPGVSCSQHSCCWIVNQMLPNLRCQQHMLAVDRACTGLQLAGTLARARVETS